MTEQELRHTIGPVMIIFLTTVGAFVLALMAGGITNSFVPHKLVTEGPWTLVSARSVDSLQGKIVWGNGAVNGRLTYHVYVKNADGSLTPHQIPGDGKIKIIEDPSLSDSGLWTRTWLTQDLDKPIAQWTFFGESPVLQVNEIRVPLNSVVHSFKLS